MSITETIKKEEMDSLQKLADLSVAISEANSTLNDIRGRESQYLKLREGKAQKQIDELFNNSAELLDKIHKNYEGIHTFCNILSNYKEFLDENYASFKEMLAEFEKRGEEWDRRYGEQVAEFGRQEKIIENDKKDIEQGKKEIEKANEQIRRDKIKIADERQTLQRTVERLSLNKK